MASYDFSSTRTDIVQFAYRVVGVLSEGETLSGQQAVEGVKALNDIVKNLQAKGVFLWTVADDTLSTVAATQSYALSTFWADTGTPPPAIDSMWWAESATGDRTPVLQVGPRTLKEISDFASATGEPQYFYYELGASPKIVFYPIPDAAYSIFMQVVKPLEDWDSASTGADFPEKYCRALKWMLAGELAPLYGQNGNAFEQKGLALLMEAKGSDKEHFDEEVVKGAF